MKLLSDAPLRLTVLTLWMVTLGLMCAGVAFAQSNEASVHNSAVALTSSMQVLDDKRALQVGDRLSVRIVEDRENPIQVFVTDSGEIEAPYVGRVMARGKTCKQLAQSIKALLDRDFYYDATVIVGLDAIAPKQESRGSRGLVYMRGALASTSPLLIPEGEKLTLSKAILLSGGFGPYANRRKVQVIRKSDASPTGTEILTVDMVEVLDRGNQRLDIELQPDDIVTVPERAVRF